MSELPPNASLIYPVVLSTLLGYAAWRDLLTRTIPNRVSVALLGFGLLSRAFQGWSPLGCSLVVAIAVFLCLLPLCSRGVLGGADLKLIAALSAGLAPEASIHLIVAISVIGGLLATVYVVARALLIRLSKEHRFCRPSSFLGRIATVELWRIRRRAPLPYGLAIALGTAATVLSHRGV